MINLSDKQIQEKVNEWRQSFSSQEIWEYIGITRDQYRAWAERYHGDLEADVDHKNNKD